LLVTIIIVWLVASLVIGVFYSNNGPSPSYGRPKPPPVGPFPWRGLGIVLAVLLLIGLIGHLLPH
jgi:hypothetical protein